LPEGDTLRKLVRLLAPELEGCILVDGRLPRHPALRLGGWQVSEVHALGKHLFIEFLPDRVLRTHLANTATDFDAELRRRVWEDPAWWREVYLLGVGKKQQHADWLEQRPRERRDRPCWWDEPPWDGPNRPVVGVSWHEALAYCRWLEDRLRQETPGAGIRLPSEAEW
jgi:hypothetical protein